MTVFSCFTRLDASLLRPGLALLAAAALGACGPVYRAEAGPGQRIASLAAHRPAASAAAAALAAPCRNQAEP